MGFGGLSQKIASIGGIIALLGTLFGAVIWINGYFTPMSTHLALAAEVSALKNTQTYMNLTFQQKAVEQRIWTLQDRYQDLSKMPQSVKEEYNSLVSQNQELKDGLKDLQKKSINAIK